MQQYVYRSAAWSLIPDLAIECTHKYSFELQAALSMKLIATKRIVFKLGLFKTSISLALKDR
jgi:hypothetical protein